MESSPKRREVKETDFIDCHGNKIYEGDLLRDGEDGSSVWEVRWNEEESCFCPFNLRVNLWCASCFKKWNGKFYWIKVGSIYDKN